MASASGQLRAMQEATQLLVHLGIDTAKPIDPFKAIDDLRLELRFESMADLWGVIVPADPPHVIINNRLPASVQRFTAAHELGHWVLDNERLTLDMDADIEGISSGARERNAQIFAGHFLMPLPLLYEVAARHGVRKGERITAQQVYKMARDMHVSYAAAVHQLANVNFITNADRAEFLRVRPAKLKSGLAHGVAIANARGDVWPVEVPRDSLDVDVFAGDEIIVSLPESPSTGFTWMPREAGWTYGALDGAEQAPLTELGSSAAATSEIIGREETDELTARPLAPLEIVNDVFESDPRAGGAVGGVGSRIVGLAVTAPGDWSVEMKLVRPFAPGQQSETVELRAHVRPLPQEETKRRWIQAFREEDAALAHIERDGSK